MDPENVAVERVGKNAQKKIADIEAVVVEFQKKVAEMERAVKAMLVAVKKIEEDQGEVYMAAGTFCGVQFDE